MQRINEILDAKIIENHKQQIQASETIVCVKFNCNTKEKRRSFLPQL